MRPGHRQSGFSLIELMVAASIGLAFSSIALTSLVNSRVSFEQRTNDALVIENGRLAMEEITDMVRMAGYVNVLSPGAEVPVSAFFTGPCGDFDPCTKDGTGTESDQIAFLLNPPPDDGTETDCVGNSLHEEAVIAARSVVAHLFLISEHDGSRALSCQTFLVKNDGTSTAVNETPQELVPGVDSMQILYGKTDMQDARELNTQLSYYASADVVSASTPPDGSNTPWIGLVSVQIALLVNSGQEDNSQDLKTRKFKLLDGPEIEHTDQKLWQVFTQTTRMNNTGQ